LQVLRELASFVREVLARTDLARTTVILTSDHGNVEDLSTRNHTLNPSPRSRGGRAASTCARRVRSLADITPAILELLTQEPEEA
jgi:2,3-bisphosphoglycerate-independent phosphoglycerate mutase